MIINRLTIVFCLLLVLCCRSRGTKENILEILKQNNYVIECRFQGCFGSGTEKLEIKNNEVARYTFLPFGEGGGPIERTREISWGSEKEMILKEIFEIGIELEGTGALCTTTATYTLSGGAKSIEFNDLNCSVAEKFDALIN